MGGKEDGEVQWGLRRVGPRSCEIGCARDERTLRSVGTAATAG